MITSSDLIVRKARLTERLEQAIESNRKLNLLLDSKGKLKQGIKECEAITKVHKLILNAAKREDNNFKFNRISYIEEMIKSNLDVIFPEEDIEVKLSFKELRGSQKLSLLFKEKNDTYFRNPLNSSGGLAQQIISFSSSMGILNLLDKHKFFIDEAFGNGDPENKEKLSKLLGFYSESNQIFLISQSSELYVGIPRREIRLEKINDKVVCKSIKDFKKGD